MAIWLTSSRRSLAMKWTVLSLVLAAVIAVGYAGVLGFDRNKQVLEPAIVDQGRIVHRSLGLSYLALPNCTVVLEPSLSVRDPVRKNRPRSQDYHFLFGNVATISRMTSVPPAQESSRAPWSIVLEVQRDTMTELNSFILNIRREEERWSQNPKIRILRRTHLIPNHRPEWLEFVSIQQPRGLISRQVFFRNKGFLLNFTLNPERDSDNRLFDRFLESIRLDG